MKWEKNIIYKYNVILETGLHIGGLNDTVQIGGIDAPVFKTYKNYETHGTIKVPVIPGSSIKGKIRSLMELKEGHIILDSTNKSFGSHKSCEDPNSCNICKLFGVGANPKSSVFNKSRLIFRDAAPSTETIDNWNKNEDIIEGGEVKGENTLNRITSAANPRFLERVPAGSVFALEIVMTLYDNDDEEELTKKLKEGITLLQDSYIGGSGSRGYGKIRLVEVDVTTKTEKDY